MKFTFIKTARHRTFYHQPIYYDEQKDEREDRARRIKSELGLEQEEDNRTTEEKIRGRMRRKIQTHFEVSRKEKRKSNLRLAIILIGLVILFYYLFMTSAEWILKYM
ncbi:hypothetical protein E9993_19075 [Labilibacter sediminis]|nr:hypothetical protein E9993_19075 [Labilibacter sediminis]